GDVPAGKRRTADIADIALERERVGARFADELGEPFCVAHFAAVRLAILEDLDAAHASLRLDAHRVGDELAFAEHLIDDEPAAGRCLPDALAAAVLERIEARAREEGLLRLLNAQVD